MLDKQNKRDKSHLFNLIGKRSNHTPNFALLIGAGASVSSGVKPSCQMVGEWRQQMHQQSKTVEPLEKWLQGQNWYEDEEEYSILFEKVYDQRSQRRIYIEECVKNAKPSWGYIYLANMIAHGYFNVIFTPNFDDLLNEACFVYADCRPIVCAHDSAVVDIRVTSVRPKILKLHGDYLYNSIKNTIRETETLEKNMRDKFMQFAREYGLVVAGYAGNDRSIMDILDGMLMSGGYFPNGLYWCVRSNDTVNRKVERLLRRENAYWVEIEGFDEFMAELHESLELTLPNAVGDPYKATTERLNRFVSLPTNITNPVIREDMKQLEDQIRRFEQVVLGKGTTKESDELVPNRLLGDLMNAKHDYRNASVYYEKALLQNPDDLDLMEKLCDVNLWTENFEKSLQISETIINRFPNSYLGYYRKGRVLTFLRRFKDAIEAFSQAYQYTAENSEERYFFVLTSRSNVYLLDGNWEAALSDAESASQADAQNASAVGNKCVALKKLGRKDEASQILHDVLPETTNTYMRACFLAILNEKQDMLRELATAIKEEGDRVVVNAKFDPDFADYREDPDFQKLVSESASTP